MLGVLRDFTIKTRDFGAQTLPLGAALRSLRRITRGICLNFAQPREDCIQLCASLGECRLCR